MNETLELYYHLMGAAAVLDFTPPQGSANPFHLYADRSSALAFHRRFGGRTRFAAQEFGRGLIPGGQGLVQCSTYLIGQMGTEFPGSWARPWIPGFGHIFLPVYNHTRAFADGWPIIVQRDEWYQETGVDGCTTTVPPLYAIRPDQIAAFLRNGPLDFGEPATVEMTYNPHRLLPTHTLRVPFLMHSGTSFQPDRLRDIVAALLTFSRLTFSSDRNGYGQDNRFWSRLGISARETREYFIMRGGVAQGRISRDQLSQMETLEALAPPGLHIITPTFFLEQFPGYGCFAIGLFQFPGSAPIASDIRISDSEFELAKAGFYDSIYRKCRLAARRSFLDAPWRHVNRAVLARVIRGHENDLVDFADSRSLPGCESQFLEALIPGATSAPLAEILQYFDLRPREMLRLVARTLRRSLSQPAQTTSCCG
jgi:hypothetical protein